MAKYDIISGTVLHRLVLASACPTYHGVYKRAAYIEFPRIESPSPILFAVGDYVDYDRIGLRFKLYDRPFPKKQARRNTYGAAFVYENLQFFAATKDLELTPFFDLVLGDNELHFSSRKSASTFENVSGIKDRLQACMDSLHPGEWEFRVSAPSDIDVTEAKEFSIEGTVMDALNKIGDVWEDLGWIHTVEDGVNIITIGGANTRTFDNTTELFMYGKGRGLKVIAASVSNKNEITTRIHPFGSERNILPSYYRGKDIYDAPGVDIPNLMIPISTWGTTEVEGVAKPDPKKAFLQDSTAVAKYGVITRRVYFDGSEQKEIYPTIEGVTIGEVRDANPPITPNPILWPDRSRRVDSVYSVDNPQDSGFRGEGLAKYTYTANALMLPSSKTILFNNPSQSYDCNIDIYVRQYSGPSSLKYAYVNLISGGTISFTCAAEDCTITLTFKTFGPSATPTTTKTMRYTSHGYATYGTGMQAYSHSCRIQDILSDYGDASVEVALLLNRIDGINLNAYYGESMVVNFSGNGMFGWYPKFQNSFTMRIPQIGFNPNDQAALGSGMTIAMKDGTCAGREFPVTGCQYISSIDAWELTLTRVEDTSIETLYPNANGYEIAVGDHFVVLDISMPELYINIASNRLYTAAQELLSSLCTEKMLYTPEIDAKVMAEQGRVIREGMFMAIQDDDLNLGGTGGEADLFSSDDKDLFSDDDKDLHADDDTAYVRIDSVTINEGDSSIPTFRVTLAGEKRTSALKAIIDVVNRNAQRENAMYNSVTGLAKIVRAALTDNQSE